MKYASLLAFLPCVAMAGNLSIAVVAGYGLPVPGTYIGRNSTSDTRSTPTARTHDAVYGSYADGIRIGGEIGYAMNENVTLGLGVRYEASSEYEFTEETQSAIGTEGFASIRTETKSVSGIAFVPSIVYSLPGEVYRPYMRVNGHFGIPAETVKGEIVNTGGESGGDVSYEVERTGGVAWGFGGGLGVEYAMSPAMSILCEVVSESWTWEATKAEFTKYTAAGEDQLGDMDASKAKIKYLDSYAIDGATDPDSPSKELRALHANSAISMIIGLKYRF